MYLFVIYMHDQELLFGKVSLVRINNTSAQLNPHIERVVGLIILLSMLDN